MHLTGITMNEYILLLSCAEILVIYLLTRFKQCLQDISNCRTHYKLSLCKSGSHAVLHDACDKQYSYAIIITQHSTVGT